MQKGEVCSAWTVTNATPVQHAAEVVGRGSNGDWFLFADSMGLCRLGSQCWLNEEEAVGWARSALEANVMLFKLQLDKFDSR